MKDSSRTPSARGSSVRQDWRTWLPDEKALVFRSSVCYLESLYNMFSIALNEAIELKRLGYLPKSLMAVGMASELCALFSSPLVGMLHALHEHAKHYGLVPNAVPLEPENFRRQRGQRSARISGLLNRILFSQRVQFLQKVSTLEEMVEDLDRDFRSVALELAEGASIDPENGWAEVDAGHYDLNTCFRETLVLFKSFLVVLPANQLPAFQRTVRDQWQVPRAPFPVPQRLTHNRRFATVAGE